MYSILYVDIVLGHEHMAAVSADYERIAYMI